MSALLAMTIAGLLHPISTGILSVGSACTATNGGVTVPSNPPYSASMSCTLPDGCAAGDVVVLSCNAENFNQGIQWVGPDGAVAALASQASGAMIIAVFAYTLTQAHVDAGSVAMPLTATQGGLSISATVIADVYRSLGTGLVDVTGTLATGSISGTTVTATAAGVTTPRTGDMLQYALFATATPGAVAITQPDGFTGGAVTGEYWGQTFTTTGHALQAAAGASGDEAVGVQWGTSESGTYAVVLLALKSKAIIPMTLTGTIPDGTADGSVDVHLTLGGDFTAPVTISGLPAWLSATMSDTDVEVTGTYPATANTYTFTVTATDSSTTPQTADDAQSVVVSAATATTPSLVQSQYKGVASSPISVTLAAPPTAGNMLVLTVFPAGGQSITTPAGFTACDKSGENTSRPMWVYYKISDGSEQTVSADFSPNAAVGATYSEWQDATTVSALTGTSFSPGISSGTAGPSAAPPNASAIPVYWLVSRAQTPFVATVGAGWTIDPNYAGNVFYAPCQAYMTTAPNAAVSIDFTLTGTDSSYFQWTTAWIY